MATDATLTSKTESLADRFRAKFSQAHSQSRPLIISWELAVEIRDALSGDLAAPDTGLAGQIEAARARIAGWPADVRAAMGLPVETSDRPPMRTGLELIRDGQIPQGMSPALFADRVLRVAAQLTGDPYKAMCQGGSGGKCTDPDCEKCWPEEPSAGNHAPACAAHDGKRCNCGIGSSENGSPEQT